MKKLICLLLVLGASSKIVWSQNDFVPRVTDKGQNINGLDDKGKKHGFWEAYINEDMKIVKKKKDAAFVVLEFYDHGRNLWKDFYFNHSTKFRLIEPLPRHEIGNPKLLNGSFAFRSKSEGVDHRYEFENGHPQEIIYESTARSSKKDKDVYDKYNDGWSRYYQKWNFEEQFNGTDGTFQSILYEENDIISAYWLRPINGYWGNFSSCGLCSNLTDSTFTVNNLTWSNANLRVTNFRNGDEIYYAETIEDFELCIEQKVPAFSDFKGFRTYNWYALNDPRGLAPEGWRLPEDHDFKELRSFLGSNHVIFLRSSFGTISSNDLGNNMSGFDGTRVGNNGPWWSSTEENAEFAHAWILRDTNLQYDRELQCTFYAVRCIKLE